MTTSIILIYSNYGEITIIVNYKGTILVRTKIFQKGANLVCRSETRLAREGVTHAQKILCWETQY